MPTPDFFVPNKSPEEFEPAYAEFAQMCGAAVPDPIHRIYSITYFHDGEEWTATVGEKLKGVRISTHRIRGNKVERRTPIYDSATVLAIFAGYPNKVVTDKYFDPNVRSHWENPFMVGNLTSRSLFTSSAREKAGV